MNTQPTPSEDPLEVLLRKDHAPLADDGFSARVLAALPPPAPKSRRVPGRRTIACSLGALTGFIFTIAHSGLPRASELSAFGSLVQTSAVSAANSLSDPTVLAVGTLILTSLAFAYSREITAKLAGR